MQEIVVHNPLIVDATYREIAIATTIIATVILILTIIYFLAVAIGPYLSPRLRREFLEPQPDDAKRTDLVGIDEESRAQDDTNG